MLRCGLLVLPLAAAFAGRPGPGTAAPTFRGDVLPLLQRQGCASAYCHGSANGRGGFKLSLFGSDPRADWRAITRDLDGRRIDLVDPGASLVLAKPSLRLRHGGGRRLPRDGEAFATLRSWIARGAPFDAPGELVGLRLERHDDRVRTIATLRTAAGDQERDVTDRAMLSSSDPDVASIDDRGHVRVLAPGRAWLFARYDNRDARLAVTQPFDGGGDVATNGEVDVAWAAELRELGLAPAPLAPDVVLARRLYLDLVGRAPTPAELDAFLAQDVATRRAATAATLLREPAFAQVWGEHLADWLELPADGDGPPQRQAQTARLRRLLVDALAAGETMNAIAERLLRDDDTLLRRQADPRDRAELVGRAFLGLRIGCARCHDHPLDRWRRDEHLAFSAFFADPRPDGREGQMFEPTTGDEIEPHLLPLGASRVAAGDRRAQLLQFVIDEEHASFARNVANRAFAVLFGRGLVEPPDDHRLSNPPALPRVLDALTRVLTTSDGDLRAVLLAIVTSRPYASDSRPLADAARDRAARRFFARREARPLPPQRLGATVAAILGVSPIDTPPLPESPLARQLALLNGPLLDAALDAGGTTVDALVDFGGEPDEQLTALFRLILSRPPSDTERARFETVLAHGDRRAAVRDLARALFLCREFGSLR